MRQRGGTRRGRRLRLGLSTALGMALAVGVASASGTTGPGQFQPGAPGLGDPYFPLRRQRRLRRRALPARHHLSPRDGRAHRSGHDPRQGDEMTVRVQSRPCRVDRGLDRRRRAACGVDSDGGELVVRHSPRRDPRRHHQLKAVVRYHGIPEPVLDPLGVSGFIATDDGVARRRSPARGGRPGSPRTTIRSTRRPTPSGSRSRKASRRSATER